MIPTKHILTGLCVFHFIFIGAQTVTPNELDSKYRPNDSSPFSQVSKKPGEAVDVELVNAFKYCPTMLFRQKVMFFYERKLINGFTMSLGVGKAFGNDPLQSGYFSIWNTDQVGTEISLGNIFTYGQYYGSGAMLSAAARIYFSGEAFDGGFVEFNYRHDRLSYQLPPATGGIRIEGNPIVDVKMSNFNFGFGFTNTGGKRGHAVHEFFITAGIKNFSYSQFTLQDNSSVSGQQGDMVYTRTNLESQARIAPSIHITYCFGFGW